MIKAIIRTHWFSHSSQLSLENSVQQPVCKHLWRFCSFAWKILLYFLGLSHLLLNIPLSILFVASQLQNIYRAGLWCLICNCRSWIVWSSKGFYFITFILVYSRVLALSSCRGFVRHHMDLLLCLLFQINLFLLNH